METQRSFSALSLDDLELLESMCARLEGSEDSKRQMEAFLGEVSQQLRNQFLVELLWHEIERRKRLGQVPKASDYDFGNDEDRKAVAEVFAQLKGDAAFMALDHPSEMPSRKELPERYEKVEELGKGGIGSVWRVFDLDTQRPLAIKTLRKKFRKDRQANLRLEREAILTGVLQHPGIPPVHNHGLLSDLSVFFAMKLVEGQTLEQILSQRAEDESDSQEIIRIFEKVTQTMAYVHSQSVIHRDLKPQNIMVGQFAEVQVMDWGMAKRLNSKTPDSMLSRRTRQAWESTPRTDLEGASTGGGSTVEVGDASSIRIGNHELTQMGDIIGTPAYMPPEQARGELDRLDASSDVYSLGAILFEILTKERVVSGGSTAQVLQQVTTGDLKDSWKKLEQCNADEKLIELCRRCLAADQADRPQDAGVIAAELSEHFANTEKRIRAAEIELRETEVRAKEESKRRQTFARMLMLLVGVFAAGLAGVIWQWSKAEAAGELAQKNAKDYKNAATLAENNAQLAEENSKKHLQAAKVAKANAKNYQEGLKVFTEAFQSANMERGANTSMTAAEVLRQAHQSLLDSDLEDDGRMLLLEELGKCFRWTGEYALAAEITEESVRLHEARYGKEHPETLTEINGLGIVLVQGGRYEEAQEVLERTVKLNRKIRGDTHLETLKSMTNLAGVYEYSGQIDKARVLSEQVLTLAEGELGARHPETLTMMNNLAASYRTQGKMPEAAELFAKTLKLSQDVRGQDHPETLNTMLNLADTFGKLGRIPQAVKVNQEMLTLCRNKLGDEHPLTCQAENNLAYLYNNSNRASEAVALLEKTVVRQTDRLGEHHVDTLKTMLTLAAGYKQMGNLGKAIETDKKAYELLDKNLGPDHPETLTAMNNMAHTYFMLNEREKAVPFLRKGMEARQRKFGKAHPQTLLSMNNLSVCLKSVGKLDESLELDQEKLALCLEHLGKFDYQTWMTLNSLAATYVLMGRLDEAIKTDEIMLGHIEDYEGPLRQETLISLSRLAQVYRDHNHLDQAVKLSQKQLELSRRLYGEEHPNTSKAMNEVAKDFQQVGEFGKSAELFESVLKQLRVMNGEQGSLTLDTMNRLAEVYESNEQLGKAKEMLLECLESRKSQSPQWKYFDTLSQLGGVLLGLEDLEKASEALTQSMAGLEEFAQSNPGFRKSTAMRKAIKRMIQWSKAENDEASLAAWEAKLGG